MKQIPPTGRRTGRLLRAAVLPVLTALLAVLAPVTTPTVASAADYNGLRYVSPVLNCIQAGTNGAYTAVLGYENTSSSTFTISGSYNQFYPSSYDGSQPTVFRSGTHNGVFSLPVRSGTVYWRLADDLLTIRSSAAPACPKDTQMPADGNGTGVVGALAVAAGLGALIVHRARRRAAASPSEETVDA